MKIKCPVCKENIQHNAEKCPHCTADLTTEKNQKEMKRQVRTYRISVLILVGLFTFFVVIWLNS